MVLRSLILCLGLTVWLTVPARAEPVTVFAAASLKNVLEAAAASFPEEITFVFAGSSTLARQIEAGAPADVFVSANVAWMDHLEERGRLAPGTRSDLVGNSLVVIAPRGAETPAAPLGEAAFWGEGRIAMALVRAVPAGIYGQSALASLDLWEALRPRVIEADSVRVALAFVALGEASRGIVYASDAVAEPRVAVLADIPAALHPPIIYPGAVVAGARPAARTFLDHLRQPQVRALFEAQGFLPLEP